MWNNTNPAELFPSTTWELIAAGKYIQSGSSALSTGGSNSVSIGRANLPNIKLKVDTFSLTTQPHTHTIDGYSLEQNDRPYVAGANGSKTSSPSTSSGGGQNTGTASPSTETLGSGTPIDIEPEFITLKFWKRLS